MREAKIIRVDECMHDAADYPDKIHSGGLGPCIAIGLLVGRRAYLLHSALITCEVTDANGRHAFFNRLDCEISAIHRPATKVVIIGSQIDKEEDAESQTAGLEARDFVIRELGSLGFSTLHIQWCPEGADLIQSMTIDTVKRHAIVELIKYRADDFDIVSRDVIVL